ncbi:MAG: hypothetical protein F6K26_20315 [Moorea sp. SIO2I5]|nr:hypothetical protein [Moorena sp. SIO2I5]
MSDIAYPFKAKGKKAKGKRQKAKGKRQKAIFKIVLSDAARSWGGSAAKGGPPHERLPWFPPLAIASRQGICLK